MVICKKAVSKGWCEESSFYQLLVWLLYSLIRNIKVFMLKHLHLLSTKTSALQNSNDELSFFAVVSLFGLIQSIKFLQSKG